MSEKLDRLNLSNVGGFLNSLNAKEGHLYCIECDTQLEWGGFAYKQEVCWDCFERKVNILIAFLRGRDTVPFPYVEADITQYMLEVVKEIYVPRRVLNDISKDL